MSSTELRIDIATKFVSFVWRKYPDNTQRQVESLYLKLSALRKNVRLIAACSKDRSQGYCKYNAILDRSNEKRCIKRNLLFPGGRNRIQCSWSYYSPKGIGRECKKGSCLLWFSTGGEQSNWRCWWYCHCKEQYCCAQSKYEDAIITRSWWRQTSQELYVACVRIWWRVCINNSSR
jgi:hypothetical protein